MASAGSGEVRLSRDRRSRVGAAALVAVGFALGVTGPFLYGICTTTDSLGSCAGYGYQPVGLGLVAVGLLLTAFGLMRLVIGSQRTTGP